MFESPFILVAVPLLWGAWVLLHPKPRLALYPLLRLLALTALIVGLAGLRRPGSERFTVLLLSDVSQSLGGVDDSLNNTLALAQSLARHSNVEVFAFDGSVVRLTDARVDMAGAHTDAFDQRYTDITGALTAALAAAPDATAVVIASDFRNNPESLAAAQDVPHNPEPALYYETLAAIIRADNARTYYLLPRSPGPDARVEHLSVPPYHSGAAGIPVTAYIAAAEPVTVQYEFSTAVNKKTGSATVPASVVLPLSEMVEPPDGPAAYVAFRLSAPGDPIQENDVARAVSLRARPPVCAVLSDAPATPVIPAHPSIVLQMLSEQELMQRFLEGRAVPDVVILSDFSLRAHPLLAASLIPAVKELGVGLFCMGGEHSFGAGGLTDNDPVAKILPASMQPPGGAGLDVTIFIDHSGSMGRGVGGVPKLDLVRKAVGEGAAALKPTDRLTLIAFNNAAQTLLEAAPYNPEVVLAALWSLTAGGGTDVAAPLKAAPRRTQSDRRSLLFLLTDGDPDRGEEGKKDAISAAAALHGLDLNIIGTGSAQDAAFLREMTRAAGGSLVLRADAAAIRDAIACAVDKARNPFVSDSPAAARYVAAHPLVAEVQPLVMARHNRLSVKAGAVTLAVSGPENAPEAIAAVGRAGLGRTAVFAGNPDFGVSPSSDFAVLISRLLGWLARADARRALVRVDSDRRVLVLEASERSHEAETPITITPVPDGPPLRLKAFKTGEYLFETPLGQLTPGIYLAALGENGILRSAPFSLPAGYEYLRTGIDGAAIDALTTAGAQVITEADLAKPLVKSISRATAAPYWFALALIAAGWLIQILRPPHPRDAA